jgi:glycosyltransferase involved in cell wall biosynthesis
MTGRGRMWHETLRGLADLCDVRSVNEHSSKRFSSLRGGRPDAWLYDGHQGPRAVREPQVIHLLEAPWNEPDTMDTLEPSFIEQVVEPSRRAAAAAAAIICPSESAKRQIIDDCGVPAEEVFVAHLGVDHAVFRPGREGGAALVAEHGGNGDRPYVLTVASVHPRKNLGALRDAVAELVADDFPHQLVVVGGPAHGRADAEALAAATMAELPGAPDRIVSLPFGISDDALATLMCGADVFCLPSLSEGFGLPAAEAMACGTPAVLSARGSLVEVGADAAVMVEPNSSDIARGIRSLLTDPERARSVGAAGAARAMAFDWDDSAAVWFEAISSAVSAGARSR